MKKRVLSLLLALLLLSSCGPNTTPEDELEQEDPEVEVQEKIDTDYTMKVQVVGNTIHARGRNLTVVQPSFPVPHDYEMSYNEDTEVLKLKLIYPNSYYPDTEFEGTLYYEFNLINDSINDIEVEGLLPMSIIPPVLKTKTNQEGQEKLDEKTSTREQENLSVENRPYLVVDNDALLNYITKPVLLEMARHYRDVLIKYKN